MYVAGLEYIHNEVYLLALFYVHLNISNEEVMGIS